jgi:hypothetical protein
MITTQFTDLWPLILQEQDSILKQLTQDPISPLTSYDLYLKP